MIRRKLRRQLVSLALLTVGLFAVASSGCALCSNCEDYTYGAYGGRWQRHDRVHGRVGSVLAPAGGLVQDAEFVEDESNGDAEELPPAAQPDAEYYEAAVPGV